MLYYWFIIYISLLILPSKCEFTKKNNCTHYLHKLASDQKDYLQCSTINAAPVLLCSNCDGFYINMTLSYKTLLSDENCVRKYFDKNRFNIIDATHKILIELWKKAHCDACFSKNNFFIFDKKLKALESCFKANKSDECLACLKLYNDVYNFYMKLYLGEKGKICYDIQDAMNRTRSKWSELKCYTPHFDKTLFLCCVCFVAILPVVFYGGSYAYTKHREKNCDVLSADAEYDNYDAISGVASISKFSDAQDAVNFECSEQSARLFNDNDSDYSNDEDDEDQTFAISK